MYIGVSAYTKEEGSGVEDQQIVGLFWSRSEEALNAAAEKYGAYCFSVANNILGSKEDSEECVNDTYLRAWNAIPPHKPENLAAFLGKIARNLAFDRYAAATAEKRGGRELPLVLDELRNCLPEAGMEESLALTDALNRFLDGLKPEQRKIFMLRYWQVLSVEEVAKTLCISQSKVKMTLLRTRRQLREFLEKEELGI